MFSFGLLSSVAATVFGNCQEYSCTLPYGKLCLCTSLRLSSRARTHMQIVITSDIKRTPNKTPMIATIRVEFRQYKESVFVDGGTVQRNYEN